MEAKERALKLPQLSETFSYLKANTPLVFIKVSKTNYPVSNIKQGSEDGQDVSFLRVIGSSPPAQIRWTISGHTCACEWKDLRFPSPEAHAAALADRPIALVSVGDRVMRGPDWKSGDEDGGLGGVGQVLKTESEGLPKGDVRVQWENSEGTHTYRMAGADGGQRDLLSLGPAATAYKPPLPAHRTGSHADALPIGGLEYRAVRRVAAIPGFIDALLDVSDHYARQRLLRVPFVRLALADSKTVGSWVLKRLADPRKRATVLEYFETVSANESNAVFAALPWANLNPIPNNGISEYIKNTGKARANSRSRFGWGFTRRIFAPASGDSSGGSGAIIAHGSIDFCSFGAPAPNGWDWQWWERFNTIKSWRESQRHVMRLSKSGALMTLSEAREVLAHRVLCPGEDSWAAVLIDNHQEKLVTFRATRTEGFLRRVLRGARGQDRSVVPSSTVVGGSKAKEINQIDEPESLIMDWVQVGNLRYSPGTSYRTVFKGKAPTGDTKKAHPKSEDNRLLESSVILWKPLGSATSCPLLEALIDLDDEVLRTKTLQTAVLQEVLLRAETVGSWIVGRLINEKHQRPIAEYLHEVSKAEQAASTNAELAGADHKRFILNNAVAYQEHPMGVANGSAASYTNSNEFTTADSEQSTHMSDDGSNYSILNSGSLASSGGGSPVVLSTEKSHASLISAFDTLQKFLPAMLKLPGTLQERLVAVPLVTKVLDMKLAKRPLAVALVCFDLACVALLLVLYLLVVANRTVLISGGPPATTLAFLGLVNVYFAAREVLQMWSMHKIGHGSEYFTDGWNLLDLAGCLNIFVVVAICGGSYTGAQQSSAFRIIASMGCVSVWLKVLGTIKVLNIKLATFVFALGTIVNDLKEFALVMTIVVLMFSCIFLILHAEGTSVIAGDDGDDVVDDDLFADTRPFQYFGFSALTVFMMIMGDFSQDMFETNDFRLSVFSLWMFVVFMFFVVIIMLNVLIAVVSDSYDYAMTRASGLFLRTRLVLVAELDALGLTRENALPMWLLDFLHSSARFVPKWLAADSWLSLKTAASDMEGVWLGRVINTELSTTAIVENEVTSGVAKILAHQKSHMNEMEDGLAARLAAIEETIAATNREERVDFFSDSDDSDF